jgi:CARDB
MRPRPLIALVVAAVALTLLPAAANAAPLTTLKVRACQAGDKPSKRLARFHGRMRRIPGTRRMTMRFSLLDHSSAGRAVVRRFPRLRRSRRGVRSFGYTQTVTGLKPGGVYAATVVFRWVGRHGQTIRRVRRTSGKCRQEGALPNLRVRWVSARIGEAPRTEAYKIAVTNRGKGWARAINVHLFVDSAVADAAFIEAIGPGETETVEISGPVCRGRVRAVVDRGDTVPETLEGDNTLRRTCPPVAR